MTRHVVNSVSSRSHESKDQLEDAPDFVILKVDLKNAFNKVSRFHILRLVREHFPGLARWVTWCYGNGEDPYLWFGNWVLRSQEGVQQGDPLGPLLFSLVIQEIIVAISAELPDLKLNLWYLDDGVIAGKNSDVLRAFQIIQNLGPPLGMDLNLSKNELVKFADGSDDFPAAFKRFDKNFELLGSPIGDMAFCTAFMSNFVRDRMEHTMLALRDLTDVQAFHFLFRLTASTCKVVHLLRSVPPIFCNVALPHIDATIREHASRMGILA